MPDKEACRCLYHNILQSHCLYSVSDPSAELLLSPHHAFHNLSHFLWLHHVPNLSPYGLAFWIQKVVVYN